MIPSLQIAIGRSEAFAKNSHPSFLSRVGDLSSQSLLLLFPINFAAKLYQ
jgi:hypothetical protein